jgi:uncharacterized protein (TIGR00730 family)
VRLCVFCGSSNGRGTKYVEAARALGRQLADSRIGLVYGGAQVGTMCEIADAALAAGGEVVGVIPQQLVDREIAHTGLSQLHVVTSMHERKAMMAKLSDGFIALPGGAGTLEELFEVWTWGQLGLHAKPVGLLDVDGYFRHLRALLDHMVAEEFLSAAHRDALIIDGDPATLLARFHDYAPAPDKWNKVASDTT